MKFKHIILAVLSTFVFACTKHTCPAYQNCVKPHHSAKKHSGHQPNTQHQHANHNHTH